jgi:hypothetical protein
MLQVVVILLKNGSVIHYFNNMMQDQIQNIGPQSHSLKPYYSILQHLKNSLFKSMTTLFNSTSFNRFNLFSILKCSRAAHKIILKVSISFVFCGRYRGDTYEPATFASDWYSSIIQS